MKKIMTLFAAAVIAGAAWAHTTNRVMPINRALPEKQAMTVQQPNFEAAAQQAPAVNVRLGQEIAKNYVAKTYNEVPKHIRRAAMDETLRAGYLNPDGSYFCGIDKYGSYIWANFVTVIGSWMNGYDAWVWPNISYGATQYEYQNAIGIKYPQYNDMGNTIDGYGNWVDSLPAIYKGDMDSYFSYRMPLQIASNGVKKDSFAINTTYSGSLDTVINNAMTLGGIYNPIFSDDGMWPMTKAMFMDLDYGFTLNNVWGADSINKEVEYIFGSSKVSYPTQDTLGNDTTIVYKPTALMQLFEKPMSPLYVHDITVAIGAYEYNADSAKYLMCAPTFDTLGMVIMNLEGTKVFYAGFATINDTTNMMYIPGALVNFKIESEDEFGEKTIGTTIDEAYMLTLFGLDNEGNNFGIYTGMNMLTGGLTFVADGNDSLKTKQYFPGDPFIMFNGVMNTLEDGHKAMGYSALGDTINIEVVEEDGEWIAIYAEGDMKGYILSVTATDLLYDTTTMLYNYAIDAPEWAEFDQEIYTDSKGYNYWNDYGIYYLLIWGDATNPEVEAPKVGDQIVFSQYGRKIVYNVVSTTTGLKNIKYINDGKRYDVLGKEVDENYKGVVIMNGKKMLQ